MSNPPHLGKSEDGTFVRIDLDNLIESRLLIQANSGAGKSYCLRKLLEQTHGQVQQIVLDVEGEFHTLREHYDYILAGGDGADCPAQPASAQMLARKLLELRVSAIIDIFSLKVPQRHDFMRRFLGALDQAPRKLWHPVLVIVDEAHKFAPQSGKTESGNAVMDLMANGRKRGHCGILACQRISKLHKDVAAEANNKLIGRCALDLDMKRAADELGFHGREQQHELRDLDAGVFYAFGPALTRTVTKFKVAKVRTTHPRPGQSIPEPKAPSQRVKTMLAKLTDLPEAAKKESQTVAELQTELRAVNRQLKARPVQADEVALKRAVDKATKDVERAAAIAARDIDRKATLAVRVAQSVADAATRKLEQIGKILAAKTATMQRVLLDKPAPRREFDPVRQQPPPRAPSAPRRAAAPPVDGELTLGAPHRKILTALAQHPDGLTKKRCAITCCYAVSGGAFRNPVSALRSAGYIEPQGEPLQITEDGLAALGDYEPLPSGDALRDWWRSSPVLGRPHADILEALAEVHPEGMSKDDLAEAVEKEVTGGAFRNPLSKLRTLNLINGSGVLTINDNLVG